MAEEKYYGWSDIASLQEAIVFYAEMLSRGYNHAEISRMLDQYFPRIDYITCGKIRTKAFQWMRASVTNIEKKLYLAKSIIRLERICANPFEKTKNILNADAQLTHLLGLTAISDQDGPEELAAKMREFNKAAKSATDGSSFLETENAKNEPKDEKSDESRKEQKAKAMPVDEFNLSDDDKETNDNLRKARASRIKTLIKNENDKLNKQKMKVNEEGREYGRCNDEGPRKNDAGSGSENKSQTGSSVETKYSESAAEAYKDNEKANGIIEPLDDADPEIQGLIDGL